MTYVAQECVISDWLLNGVSWIESNQNSTIPTPVSAEPNSVMEYSRERVLPTPVSADCDGQESHCYCWLVF